MKRPNSEILDQIISIIEDKREMEQVAKELHDKANQLVSLISSEKNVTELATYLYWVYPEIRVKDLAQAVVGESSTHKFLNSIKSVTANINCDRCNCQIEIKSRTQLNEELKNINKVRWAEGYRALCPVCRIEVMEERHKEYEQRDQKYEQSQREYEQRLYQLKHMPYHQYLQTPEWKARRQKHLKSARYRCQVCNSPNQPLDVHHRTYARRGQEYFPDLIVLCRECHGIFHESSEVSSH